MNNISDPKSGHVREVIAGQVELLASHISSEEELDPQFIATHAQMIIHMAEAIINRTAVPKKGSSVTSQDSM